MVGACAQKHVLRDDDPNSSQSLAAELRGLGRGPSPRRLDEFEEALRPMYAALPKMGENSDGLDRKVVRYALHRFFEQRYGWHLKGLGVHSKSGGTSLPAILQNDLAPSFAVSLVERGLQDRGVNLHELAVLAASIHSLVQAENRERLLVAYLSHEIPAQTEDETMHELARDTYAAMLFHTIANFSEVYPPAVQAALRVLRKRLSTWPDLEDWLVDLAHALESRQETNSFVRKKAGFARGELLAQEVIEQVGQYEDIGCRSMKNALLELGDVPGTGRVRLDRFYRSTPLSDWMFNEPLEYLREQAAVDETDPNNPAVVISNYVYLQANCLLPSPAYSICCIDQCVPLLGRIEKEVAAPTAPPGRLLQIVANLPSDTVAAPRTLPALLANRLQEVANHHGGEVPLHGRLFAQWMHHAFPAECPFPHTAGSAPLLRSMQEWQAEDPARAYVNLTEYAGKAGTQDPHRPADADERQAVFERAGLPWTAEEELVAQASGEAAQVERTVAISVDALWRGLAFALALAAVVGGTVKAVGAAGHGPITR